MRASIAAAAVCVSVLVGVVPAAAAPAREAPAAGHAPVSAGVCASLTGLALSQTRVTGASVVAASGAVPATCQVHAVVTHPPAGDAVNVDVWLPVAGWNGRFEGVGGGGYAGGFPQALGQPVSQGYAAAATDTGHPGAGGGFALDAGGRLDWPLIQDFAYLGIHDMTVVGKAVTAAFYGRAARYAYWNGCSTGGRQGLSEAQRYPDDYDGILAGAPAINWSRFIPAEFWPELVMLRDGDFLPQCKFSAFQAAAVATCDPVGDGVRDGVIGDPARCAFDPRTLIGQATPCGAITARDAAVVAKILAGPRDTAGDFLWYGLAPGASFAGLANTTTANGTTTGAPFPIAVTHLGTWLLQNPGWDWTTATYQQYDQLFAQSVEEYTGVIGTDNPDLHAFARAGGKVLIWHGEADQLIFPQGTVNYYQRVQAAMGGPARTAQFARLFLAPGVAHCSGGPGPQPEDAFGALVSWVEHGAAPLTLPGVVKDNTGAVTATRPICLYPGVAGYRGHGDPTAASSFTCRPPAG
ncbi:MAG TPA: tannase/feruloyl esterase family alpha/beta hydrolase [Rugosimonospora sp.]|nr:tannase/feruloyl esterase family alpha/beta hydrolase [Rugosimonospora sp.]